MKRGGGVRDRKDFIENLKMANVHLSILREDIQYALPIERQKLLDISWYAMGELQRLEMLDDYNKFTSKTKEKCDA